MTALALILLTMAATAPDTGALIGNGRLTAVADDFGRVSVCRWPGPAMNDQLGGRGAGWGMPGDGRIAWFGGDVCTTQPTEPWTPGVSATVLNFGGGSSAIQQTFAAPDDDVLVSRVTLLGVPALQELVWRADFSPCSRVLPELAGIEDMPGHDFAAYTRDGRVYQFRPANPGRAEWTAAEKAQWDTFAESEGAWVVSASTQTTRAACTASGRDTAVGDGESVLWMRGAESDGARTATVFAAFATTRAEAEAALDRSMAAGFDALLAQTAAFWNAFADSPALSGRGRKDLAILGMGIDRATGAFTRDTAGGGAWALCYTRDCAWASLALDLAGRQEKASDVLRFLASCVRTQQRRGMPMGSLPLAVYGNGADALPHLALDADAPAYALGAFWRHAMAIEDEAARSGFIAQVWESAALMANFLAGWADGRTREPLYSFNCRQWRDRQDDDRLLTTYMGIDAALRLAQAAGRPEPEEWARRKVELDALIRFQLVDRQDRTWKSAHVLPYWHDLMEEDWARRGPPLPSWDTALEKLLANPPRDAAQPAAAAAALVWRGQPDRAAQRIAATEQAYAAGADSNALHAAHRIIADTAK